MMIPATDDRDTGFFFEAAAANRLVYKSCDDCGRGIHPPLPHCPHCGSMNTGWRDSEGLGELYAWTTVTHQVHPDYPVPYTVVVVTLRDSPEVRLVGRLDGAPELVVGQKMEVAFDTQPDGTILPQWRPMHGDAGLDR